MQHAPKTPGGPYKQYNSPPNSKLNETLLHHIQFNVTRLTDLYRGSGVIICGDINNLKVERLQEVYADIKNLVADPTRGKKILDVILTNAHKYYDRAVEIKESNKKKIDEEVTKAKGTYKWMRNISKLGDHLGESQKSEIRLPDHAEQGLTDIG